LGLSRQYPLDVGARSPQQHQTCKFLSYDICFYHANIPSTYTLHVDVDRFLICPIQTRIEEVMVILTLVLSGATTRSLLLQNVVHKQRPTQMVISLIEVMLRIIKSRCHKLCIAYGLTFVIPRLYGWKAFPMPKALTHTMITWALTSTSLIILDIIPGFLYAHDIMRTPHGKVCNTHPHQMESMPSSFIFVVGTPILKVPSLMVWRCVYLWAGPL
jgi:hypothetical protein